MIVINGRVAPEAIAQVKATAKRNLSRRSAYWNMRCVNVRSAVQVSRRIWTCKIVANAPFAFLFFIVSLCSFLFIPFVGLCVAIVSLTTSLMLAHDGGGHVVGPRISLFLVERHDFQSNSKCGRKLLRMSREHS